jgi:hypothetical protein
MRVSLTVAEIFTKANLSPHGPVPWGTQASESSADRSGVYVVARVKSPTVSCKACALPFIDPLPPDLDIDLEYESRRWLRTESVLYIGATKRTIRERVGEFYRHRSGDRRPHAGGQIIKLIQCRLWVYWAPAPDPFKSERAMIRAFKEQAEQVPFANYDGKKRRKRVRRLNCPAIKNFGISRDQSSQW